MDKSTTLDPKDKWEIHIIFLVKMDNKTITDVNYSHKKNQLKITSGVYYAYM